MTPEERIQTHLRSIYRREIANACWGQMESRLEAFRQRQPKARTAPTLAERLTEKDAVLITYGDQFRQPGELPLRTLAGFVNSRLKGLISTVHILPFYPYSSDDGFSVIDYYQVDPDLGSWQDLHRLGEHFQLMFDGVINHISRHSRWFEGFLKGESPYSDYFISVDPAVDLSMVVRPRALPLLTPVETADGETRHVWTTFSDDQIDLNFANPQVLLEIVEVLLYYVEQGAEIIRLDAIAYLWKEIGTPSIHLPQTHQVVKLFRAVLDALAPGVILISETNVPHQENISYFGEPLPGGDHTDEAQLVYQFPLAPLVLHTFQTGNAQVLSDWAGGLESPGDGASFFNFIASHDGIGVRPAEGLLEPAQVEALVKQTIAHGGQASHKANQDGSRSVYELNITLYDFLNDPDDPQPDLDVRRFLASQAVMLSLAGVPGIYVHSLFGSRNCQACLEQTGRARSINREKFHLPDLMVALDDAESIQRRVFAGYRDLLRARSRQPAFHPAGAQNVLDLGAGLFALLRTPPGEVSPLICLVEVSGRAQTPQVHLAGIGLGGDQPWQDLLEDQLFPARAGRLHVPMAPYQVRWLVRSIRSS